MAEQHLNGSYVDPAFDEVRRKRMAKCVAMNRLSETGGSPRLGHCNAAFGNEKNRKACQVLDSARENAQCRVRQVPG